MRHPEDDWPRLNITDEWLAHNQYPAVAWLWYIKFRQRLYYPVDDCNTGSLLISKRRLHYCEWSKSLLIPDLFFEPWRVFNIAVIKKKQVLSAVLESPDVDVTMTILWIGRLHLAYRQLHGYPQWESTAGNREFLTRACLFSPVSSRIKFCRRVAQGNIPPPPTTISLHTLCRIPLQSEWWEGGIYLRFFQVFHVYQLIGFYVGLNGWPLQTAILFCVYSTPVSTNNTIS